MAFRSIGAATCVVLLALPGGTARAQLLNIDIGPRATLLYDTNLARSSRALAAARGIERTDLRFSPGLDLDVQFPLSRQMLFLSGDLGYDFHRRNTQLNRRRILIDGGARLKFSRCAVDATLGFSSRQSDVADLVDTTSVRNTETGKSIGFEADCGDSIGLRPTFGVERRSVANSSIFRRRSDNRETSFTAGLSYARPSFGELGIVANFARLRYPERDALIGEVLTADGYRTTNIGARYERQVGARLRGSVEMGLTRVRPGRVGKTFSGLTSLADISASVGPALKLRINGSRQVKPATDFSGNFQIVRSLGAQADYALGSRISLGSGISLDRRSVRGGEELNLPRIDNERRRSLFAKASYRRGPRAQVDLELRREVRTATPSIYDYRSTRGIANLKLSF